jgi:hypothetical protein
MERDMLLDKLKKLKRKWRTAYTKEGKMADRLFKSNAVASGEKSVGITIGYGFCLCDLEKLIRELENERVQKS